MRNPQDSLTKRDIEILGDLCCACDNYLDVSPKSEGWVKPIDCGGQNRSDHSYRLTKLARKGFAEQREQGGWTRGSKKYRITEVGRALLTGIRNAKRKI